MSNPARSEALSQVCRNFSNVSQAQVHSVHNSGKKPSPTCSHQAPTLHFSGSGAPTLSAVESLVLRRWTCYAVWLIKTRRTVASSGARGQCSSLARPNRQAQRRARPLYVNSQAQMLSSSSPPGPPFPIQRSHWLKVCLCGAFLPHDCVFWDYVAHSSHARAANVVLSQFTERMLCRRSYAGPVRSNVASW